MNAIEATPAMRKQLALLRALQVEAAILERTVQYVEETLRAQMAGARQITSDGAIVAELNALGRLEPR